MIWCCPKCHGKLDDGPEILRCSGCGSNFELVGGIPDLRVPGESWINFTEDLQIARDLSARNLPLAELVHAVYATRPGWDVGRIAMRTEQVLSAPHRLKSDVAGWLAPVLGAKGQFLDLGCGAGMLIAVGQNPERTGIGIDVSMTWLVVAQRLITEWGGKPILAAALGEALPMPDNSIDAVISLDVIEHVNDPDAYLGEINRVVKSGGRIALSTPNRFSLTAEPHVFVWGVGWLPQRLQRPYVRWRSGKTYDDTRLMGSVSLCRRLGKNTKFNFRVAIPEISLEHIEKFGTLKALLAKIYNKLAQSVLLRPAFLVIGPFFRITGTKP